MVEVSVTRLMYCPLAERRAGATMASMTAVKLAMISRPLKLTLPMGTCRFAVRSVAELDTTLLQLLDRAGDIVGLHDGARARVGHQATGAEHTAQTADLAHHLRHGHGHIEIEPALLDALTNSSVPT